MSAELLSPASVVERVRVKLAGRADLERCSVGVCSKQGLSLYLSGGEIRSQALSQPNNLFLRLQKKAGIAEYFFHSFEVASLDAFIEQSFENFSSRTELLLQEQIPPCETHLTVTDESRVDPHFLSVVAGEKSNRLLNLEESLQGQVRDVALALEGHYFDQVEKHFFWSSGSSKTLSFEKSFGTLSLSARLNRGGFSSTYRRSVVEGQYFDIDWSGLGRDVLQNALKMLGPSLSLKTLPEKNLLQAQVVSEILEKFQSYFCYQGEQSKAKNPLLVHFKKSLFPSVFQISDDPNQRQSPAFCPWSSEGQQTNSTPLVSEGRPTHFCSSVSGARDFEGATSYHRRWIPEASKFEISPYALAVDLGRSDFVDLLREMKDGFLVSRVDQWLDCDLASGNLRMIVSGSLVCDGEIVGPLTQITLTSNFFDVFQGLLQVGRDKQSRGNFSSPSILFGKLPLSGA